MTYKASLDTLAKIVTLCITILFAGIVYAMLNQINEVGFATPLLIAFLLLGIYFITFLYRPLSYSIKGDKVIISRIIGNKDILLSDIASVELVEKKNIMWAMRLWAVGGLFGYFGIFSNGRYGKMTWYATNLSNAVMIETKKGKRILLTPENKQEFLLKTSKMLNTRLPDGQGFTER